MLLVKLHSGILLYRIDALTNSKFKLLKCISLLAAYQFVQGMIALCYSQ